MNSKRRSTTIILVVLIVMISYFAYTLYIAPMFLNNYAQTEELDLNSEHSLVLKAHEGQQNIEQIEFEITGNSTENVRILMSDPSGENQKDITVKKGELEYVTILYSSADSCYLHISTKEKATGSLTINYRFIGSN